MVATPESFKPQRELILECPDLAAFVSRPTNFRAGGIIALSGLPDMVVTMYGKRHWVTFLEFSL